MTAPLPQPPRDPLATKPRVMPGPQHTAPAFELAELRDMPFVSVPVHELVTVDAASILAEPVAESTWSAASVAMIAVRELRRVSVLLDALDRDEALSPIGRLQRAVPLVDSARATLVKESRRLADAGELRRKLLARAATPTDGPPGDVAREIRATIAALTPDRRDGFVLEVGSRAVAGDADARETLLAIFGAPAAWRELHLSQAFRASSNVMLAALSPDVTHAVTWLEWAVTVGETAVRDGGEWLDARRSALGAPPERATVFLPDNGRD